MRHSDFMNRTRAIAICSALTLGWLVASPVCAFAQPNQTQPSGPPPGAGRLEGRQPGPGPRIGVEQRVQRLTERLNLTQEQQTKLRTIIQEEQQKLQELRTNTAITPPERMGKVRQLREQTNNKIREILTPEQKQRFDELPMAGMQQGAGPEARLDTNQRVQRLTQALGLTQDQQAKVRAILEQERSKIQQVRADTTLAPEARRPKMREIAQETNSKIREILTPEQKQKFDVMPRVQLLGSGGPGQGTNQPVVPQSPRGPRSGRPERPAATR